MSQLSRRVMPRALAVAACAAIAASCVPGSNGPGSTGSDHGEGLRGARVEVLGPWSGVERRRFTAVLHRFEQQTGARIRYSSAGLAGVPRVLSRRLAAGDPPDVALLPQPGLLRDLAERGALRRPSARVSSAVRRHYSPQWRRLGAYGGAVYGVWFKAAHKSLIWYDVAAFESAGIVPPADLSGLAAAAASLARDGRPVFAVSARDGWTLTDWFEDVYLHLAGPRRYDLLAAHRLPWTDATVLAALRTMATLLRPEYVAGGLDTARRTGFERSVAQAFGHAHAASMLHEGDFVAGAVGSSTTARLGVDVDVFPFPGNDPARPAVVAGGDVAVLLRTSPAADRLLAFLATPGAAGVWARRGGFVSPNLDLDLAVYPDRLTRAVARSLLDAGKDLRFDLSDLQPAAFGGQDDTGMAAELRDFVLHRDAARTASRLETAAANAYAEGAATARATSGRR